MLKNFLEKLLQRKNLNGPEMHLATGLLLEESRPYQAAAFLSLIKAKGETAEEILGAITAVKEKMVPVQTSEKMLDIVGTGGDGYHTVNISTGAAIVAASCGAKVAKHGNRSSSSKCGSADVLEHLGVDILMNPDKVLASLHEVGIAFMFAPLFHPAMKTLAPIRKGLGISTIFNLIGPLLNPAGAKRLLIGVYQESFLKPFAEVLMALGVEHALVVHSGGVDELSCLGPAKVKEITPFGVKDVVVDPEKIGLKKCSLESLKGGDAETNCRMLCQALKGEKSSITSTLALNAGAGLYVYGIARSVEEGVAIAQKNLAQGKPFATLERWTAFSRRTDLC